ncbi:MAG TPA: hypothetical protein VFZ66_02545 [Herpetosiphonaceae bacterium]
MGIWTTMAPARSSTMAGLWGGGSTRKRRGDVASAHVEHLGVVFTCNDDRHYPASVLLTARPGWAQRGGSSGPG